MRGLYERRRQAGSRPGVAGRSDVGLTLLELVIASTIFTVVAMAVAYTLTRGMEHRRNSSRSFVAMSAFRDLAAEIQNTANQPTNLSTLEGIGSVYKKFHNVSRSFADGAGAIRVTCHADERSVPADLGGPQDLNFDGDAADNLSNQSGGSDLKLVPLTLFATIGTGNSAQTITLHRLIAVSSD